MIAGQAAAVLLAFIILAVVYLPIFESLKYMGTGEYYANRIFLPAPLFKFISLLTPKHAFETYNAIPWTAAHLGGGAAYHQGIVGALLALQAIRAWPPVHRAFVGLVAIVFVLLMGRYFGVPGIHEFIQAIPVFDSIRHSHLQIGIAIPFTLMVPFGVHGLLNTGVRLLPLAGGAAVILGALAYTTGVIGSRGIWDIKSVYYITIAVLFIVAAVALTLRVNYARHAIVPVLLLVLLSWSELTFYVNHHKLSRTDRFFEPPRFVRFLQMHTGIHRIASYGYRGIPPEYGGAYGIYQIDTMDFQIFPRYFDLFNRLFLPDRTDRWVTFTTLVRAKDKDKLNLAAFDMLGTKYLVTPFNYTRLHGFMDRSGWPRVYQDTYFTIYENPLEPPRATIVPRLVADEKTPVDIGRSPREIATTDDVRLLEQARAAGLTGESGAHQEAPGIAAITRYDNARVELVANLASPGILVLNDAWHANWSVTVNGQKHYLGVVNQAFRGMVLPAGNHTILMTYAPRSLPIAKVLTILGLLIAIALWFARRRLDLQLAHFYRRRE